MWKRFRSRRTATDSGSSSPNLQEDDMDLPGEVDLGRGRHQSTGSVNFQAHSQDFENLSPLDRRPSVQSNISDIYGQLVPPLGRGSGPARQRSQDRRTDPLGLTVLHTPSEGTRTADVVFIHGLGGTSHRTWCKNRNLDFLWPKIWLPTDLPTARILTFGYNAHFSARKEVSTLTINDFASDLLFRMKYGEDTAERLGQVPIVIVAHSMGGLIFKRAFISGQMNDEYKQITSSIKSVLFLATPHRGTNLADTLNKILSNSAMLGYSTKEYVSELTSNSPTIDELNEQFRHYASKLQIFSFYETMATSVGPVKAMILGKQSSVLGYQHEVQQSLIADHHEVCKFTSPADANYQAVRGALRSAVPLVSESNPEDRGNNEDTASDTNPHDSDRAHAIVVPMISVPKANVREDVAAEDHLRILHTWLGIFVATDEEISAIEATRKPGTCENLLQQTEFDQWLHAEATTPRILWAHAPPGSGKTFCCSYIVDHLKTSHKNCVHWLFQHRDDRKRSLANMLRSVAYQIACEDARFRRVLVDMAQSGVQIAKSDVSAVWRHLFSSQAWISSSPQYWVIDGLDEADSNRSLTELVTNMSKSRGDVRILIVSRPLPNIRHIFQKIQKRTPGVVTEMGLTDNRHDIRLVATDEMDEFPGSETFKQDVVDQITTRSEGNFLWASLVLDRIAECYRQEDVKRVLQETPDGMDKLYERMVETIANLGSETDVGLSRIVLSWAMYAVRPVRTKELTDAYAHEFRSIIADLGHTFTHICGQFVVVEASGRVVLVHQTAREYLKASVRLPFPVNEVDVNQELLARCLDTFNDPALRFKIRKGTAPHMIDYAALFWSSHLDRSSAESDGVLHTLMKFFSDVGPLFWIQYLAVTQQLHVLLLVSASISTYVRRRRKMDLIKPPMLQRLPELANLEAWALDLLKVTGKFGTHLVEDPESIYKYIPSLSPRSSMLHQNYSARFASRISVSGLSNTEWDDCLARVSNSDGALRIAVSAHHLAIANDSPKGKIRLWNSVMFNRYLTFDPGEPICLISFNMTGTLLACYGLDHTYVWRVSDGAPVLVVANPYQDRALTLKFGPEDGFLIIATGFRRIYRLGLDQTPSWCALDPTLLEETSIPEGAFVNSPASMAFNADCTQIAVAYKGFPLAVWNLEPAEMISRCGRKVKQGRTTSTTWTGVNCVVWHPFNGHIIGIYRDGHIFKWGPMDDTHEEVKQELDATPSEISCSPDGSVFATSDVCGTVKIYDYAQMVLIYRLTSDDIISTIVFGPDSRRLFDLRGSYCNVWEPNCLARLNERGVSDDSASEMGSDSREETTSMLSDPEETQSTVLSLAASEAQAGSGPAITHVEMCAANSVVVYAKDNGVVELYDMAADQTAHVIAQSNMDMGVGHLLLSPKGTCVAYTLVNNRLTVKAAKVSTKSGKLLTKVIVAEKKDSGRGQVKQMLWHAKANWLLVVGSVKIQVLDLTNKGNVISEKDTVLPGEPEGPSTLWVAHPSDPEILLAFTLQHVQTFEWTDLNSPKARMSIDLSNAGLHWRSEATSAVIEHIIPSDRRKLHLLVVSTGISPSRTKSTLVALDTSTLFQVFDTPTAKDGAAAALAGVEGQSITSILITDSLRQSVEQPIGFLADGQLVFLDEELWLCTAHLPTTSPANGVQKNHQISAFVATRHFFIPRDWLNNAGLGLCRVQPDGTLYCPSKGQLAVIKCDIQSSA